MKKIIFLVTTLNAGGINNFLLNLLDNIKDDKSQITFLYTLARGDAAQKFIERGMNIQPCLRHGNKNYLLSYRISKFLRGLAKFTHPISLFYKLAKLNPDILYSHDHHGQILTSAFICRLLNIKFILQVHSNGSKKLNNPSYLNILKFLFKKNDVVLFGSNSLKENYGLLAEKFEKNVNVIYYFINDLGKRNDEINETIRSKLSLDKDDVVIGYIGRLINMKHVEILIDAFSQLKGAKYKLVIIGGGDKKNELEELVQIKGIANNVQFVGKVTNPDYWLNIFDINVLPSEYEGQPIAVIECMSKGVLNICSNVTGTKEIVIDKINGLLFEFKDSKVLLEKIQIANMNPKLKKELEANAYKFYQDNFSPQILRTKFKSLLELFPNGHS